MQEKTVCFSIEELLSIVCGSHRLHYIKPELDPDHLSLLDNGFRLRLDPKYDYRELLDQLTSGLRKHVICDVEDSCNVHYIVFQDDVDTPGSCYIIGPYLYGYRGQNERKDLPDDIWVGDDYEAYIASIPFVADIFVWHELLLHLLKPFWGECSICPISAGTSGVVTLNHDTSKIVPDNSSAFVLMENRYRQEAELLDAIRAGKTEAALSMGNQMLSYFFGGSLRMGKDLTITGCTLFRKAAEEACVPAIYLDALSSRAIQQIEDCNTNNELNILYNQLIRRYCDLVRSYSRISYPVLIRDVMGYIDYHYSENIALTSIADHFSVSRNYLSSYFHTKVGEKLTDYINNIRMAHALLLLNSTDLPISEISERCGFTDTNYFTRTYKKRYGLTPQAYRKMQRS